MNFPDFPGVILAGMDLGKVGDPSALALVEYVDLPSAMFERRQFRRELLDIRRFPLGMSYIDQIAMVADLIRPLGQACHLIYDKTGGGVVAADLFTAGKRNGLFARWPRGITITGSEASHENSISKVDMVRNLQEVCANKWLAYPPDLPMIEETIAEAMAFRPEMTRTQRWLTFNAPSGAHDDLLVALAFACWSRFAPRSDRRYMDPTGTIWDSYAAAVARIGSRAG